MRRWFTLAVLLSVASLVRGQTPSAVLLVLNKDENSLATIDLRTGKIIGRVPTGIAPHEVAASTDGKLAFVANYGREEPGSTLSVIEISTQRELRRVDLGALRRPHGIVVADGKVYFTAELNKLIGRYDPSRDRVDWLLGTGQNITHMLVLSHDSSKIFTANIGSNTVSAMELASGSGGWNETLIPVGKGPEGLDMSPDGKQVWTAHSRDGGVSIIDVAGRKVIETLDLHTKRSNRLKFTPDGKRVLVSDLEGGELVVLDVPRRNQIKRIKLGKMPEGIVVTPDGSRAYVAEAGDNRVAIVDLKTLEVVDRIPTGSGPDGMAWVERR